MPRLSRMVFALLMAAILTTTAPWRIPAREPGLDGSRSRPPPPWISPPVAGGKRGGKPQLADRADRLQEGDAAPGVMSPGLRENNVVGGVIFLT